MIVLYHETIKIQINLFCRLKVDAVEYSTCSGLERYYLKSIYVSKFLLCAKNCHDKNEYSL